VILKRYLYSEISKVFVAVTCVLMLIALSNQFVILMTRAAGGEISLGILLKVLAFNVPRLLSYMLPLSLFLSIILALGRLYTDNEMIVLKACGAPVILRLRVVLVLAVMAMIVVASCSLYVAPKVALYKDQALKQDESTLLMQTITPERFHSIKQGELVFYVEKISPDRKSLENVFIAEFPKAENLKNSKSNTHSAEWTVLVAKTGKIVKENGLVYLVLEQGKRYEGLPGQKNYLRINFEEYGRLLQEQPMNEQDFAQMPSTWELLSHPSLANTAELQWRLAPPISCFILALLAFMLSKVSPRQGRFARLYPSLILYILYLNLMTLARRWMQADVISPWVGIWWVHGLFLLIAVIGILQTEGYISIGQFARRLRHKS
jgi:lipopolysaccharide export system permease protein